MRLLLALALTTLLLLAPVSGQAEPSGDVDRTVQHLLDHVSGSGLTFLRNSSSYTAAEAAGHMLRKYRHFRNDIKTPEDFIELCATRSLMSGKPYLVVTEQGEEIRTSAWLTAALAEYRTQRQAGAGQAPVPNKVRN